MVFISYSSKEYELAKRIRKILQENNIECWMAPESIPVGGDYSNEIPRAIESSDIFLVLVSKKSQESVWVPKEMDIAITLKKNIIPIHMDCSDLIPSFKFRLSDIQHIEVLQGVEDVSDIIVNRIKQAHQVPNAADVSSSLSERITLFELLGINDSNSLDIDQIRSSSNVTKSLAVPIAKNDQGEIVTLDLHHKADGPNCIIIGPVGSGKSEFIHTFMLSLALYYSSEDVRLHIVDFKGGGMVQQMKGLPHLGQCLMEYSRDAAEKFVANLKEDLRNREKLLSKYEVKNIYQYLKKRTDDKHMPMMPHVFIAFDEYRDLKVEFPDIAKEIQMFACGDNADLYGVHLIYGTQFFHGIIDESITDMITCQICSGMQENVVISEPLPNRNKIPGRLYFQSLAQDAVQLIQLAYCGTTVDPNLSNKEELKNYQWFFRRRSQRESLISAIIRHNLD